MAISQMQKLSLILPKETLDQVLLTIQQLRDVEIRDLPEQAAWQAAFQDKAVVLPGIKHLDGKTQTILKGEEALNYLNKRQQKLEVTIARLKEFLPKQTLLQSLKQKKRQLSFEKVEAAGKASDEADLLRQVRQDFKRHQRLIEKLADLDQQISDLEIWQPLETTPNALATFKHIKAVIGTIPNTADNQYWQMLQAAEGLSVQEVYRSETTYGVILFIHPTEAGRALDLETFGFKALDYPYETLPAIHLEELVEEKEVYLAEQKALETKLQDTKADLENLELELEYILNLYARELAKQKLAKSTYLVALEGWIEVNQLQAFKHKIIENFGDQVLIQDSQVTEEDWEEVPIKLRNHPLVEPFELVTEMYALPKYHEKDPTPYLVPFYFTFFGMMVADLGYGLLMILLTGLALKFFQQDKGSRRFLKFFNILGVAVSLWGMIYGSFFSFELPFKLISTTDDVITILILSVAFGFITVLTGLFLGGRQQVRMKDYSEAYTSGFAWCLILLGLLFLVIGNFVPRLSVLAPIGQWLAIINALGILVVSIFKAKGISGLGSGLYNLYNASSYVGDLVSFTRLMALGLSGGSIGSAFNLIVGLFPSFAKITIGVLLFILLHFINIFLSLLSGYVHGARLMFVEFFGKFYEGGGRAFNPLEPAEKYVEINKVHLEDK